MNLKLQKTKIMIIGLLFLTLLLASCTTPATSQCTTDNDCVPTSCCHASSAVNRESAPDCRGVLCTMECKPGTLDCGQGTIRCQEGACTVVINE